MVYNKHTMDNQRMCVQPSFRVCVAQVNEARDATTLEMVS